MVIFLSLPGKFRCLICTYLITPKTRQTWVPGVYLVLFKKFLISVIYYKMVGADTTDWSVSFYADQREQNLSKKLYGYIIE